MLMQPALDAGMAITWGKAAPTRTGTRAPTPTVWQHLESLAIQAAMPCPTGPAQGPTPSCRVSLLLARWAEIIACSHGTLQAPCKQCLPDRHTSPSCRISAGSASAYCSLHGSSSTPQQCSHPCVGRALQIRRCHVPRGGSSGVACTTLASSLSTLPAQRTTGALSRLLPFWHT